MMAVQQKAVSGAMVQKAGLKPALRVQIGELAATRTMQGKVKVDWRRLLFAPRTRSGPIIHFKDWCGVVEFFLVRKIQGLKLFVAGAIGATHFLPTWLVSEIRPNSNLKSLIFYGLYN